MNFFNLIVFILLFRFVLTKRINEISKRSAYAYSTEIEIRCFSGDSFVKLSNGKEKSIDSLEISDELLTIDNLSIISTEMFIMLDKQISKTGLFYTFVTNSGHKISLTKNHLIPIKFLNKSEKYLPAKDVEIGDYLFVLLNETIEISPIINKTIEIKRGYYAPLTMKGTLLINNVLSSCFANVKDHHLAQFYLFPLRFFYKFSRLFYLNHFFYQNNNQDLHWFIKIIFYFAFYFRPQTLIF